MFLVCVFLSGSKDHSHCWWEFWGWKLWNVWSCLQSQLSLSLAKCKNISNGRAPGNIQIIFYSWFLNQSNDLNPSTTFETGSWSLSAFGERKIQASKSSSEHFSFLKRKRYAYHLILYILIYTERDRKRDHCLLRESCQQTEIKIAWASKILKDGCSLEDQKLHLRGSYINSGRRKQKTTPVLGN